MSYTSEVLADSPAAYWRLGDASGTTAVDSSGNGHNGVYTGTVTLGATGLVPGDATTSADFSAGNSGAAGSAWMSTLTTVTFECIIKPDTVSGGSYNFIAVRDDNNGTGNGWWLVIKAGKLTALCRGTEFSGSTTLVANTKYHVAFTYDGTTAKVYLNGVLDGSSARSGNMTTANLDLLIGRWGNGGSPLYFDGKIQECAYYLTTVSSTRIAAHYNALVATDATVTAVAATATATAVAPTVSGGASVAPPAASASSSAASPAVTGTGDSTVLVPAATANAAGAAPTLTADATVTSPGATASADAVSPTVDGTANATVTAPAASASADAVAPFIFNGSPNATIDAPAAHATATAHAPGLGVGLDTDVSNLFNGRLRNAFATVELTIPVDPTPAGSMRSTKVDKAVPLPLPTLVNGRPT